MACRGAVEGPEDPATTADADADADADTDTDADADADADTDTDTDTDTDADTDTDTDADTDTDTTGDTADTDPTADTGYVRLSTGDTGAIGDTGDTGALSCVPGEVLVNGAVYTDLQQALDDHPGGDFALCEGTYLGPFVATGPVTLAGTGEVVLDGGGLGTTLTVDADATLIDLTVRGGLGDLGGGVYAAGALTARRVFVTGNTANDGGGLYVDSGVLRLINAEVSGNLAVDDGGGVYADGVTVDADGSAILRNEATRGGGLWVARGSVIGGFVAENHAVSGGGLWLEWARGADLTLSNNSADQDGGGAALVNEAGLSDTLISDNRAEVAGGGVTIAFTDGSYAYAGLYLERAAVQNNSAPRGGGVSVEPGDAYFVLLETAITANEADGDGGGLNSGPDTQVEVHEGSFTENVAGGVGGAAALGDGPFAMWTINTDFGSGATDNLPDDIRIAGSSHAYGATATVDCGNGACTP